MLATKFFLWILSMLLIVGCGVYVYFETFVDGSMTGLNPLGMLAFLAAGIATCIFFQSWVKSTTSPSH